MWKSTAVVPNRSSSFLSCPPLLLHSAARVVFSQNLYSETLNDLPRSWAANDGAGSLALCSAPPYPLQVAGVSAPPICSPPLGPTQSLVCLQSQDLFQQTQWWGWYLTSKLLTSCSHFDLQLPPGISPLSLPSWKTLAGSPKPHP